MKALLSPPSCRPSLDPCCRFLPASSRNPSRLRSSVSFCLPNQTARLRSHFSVRCSSSSQDPSSSSSSSSSSNAAGGWDEDDCNYLEAHVVDAVSLLPSEGNLFMTLWDGGEVRVDHVNPSRRPMLFRSQNPSIFLKIVSETDLILPIVVRDSAIDMLMSALHGEEKVVRPNQYHLMRDLVGNLDFEVRMVRVTERINDTYIARIYVGKENGVFLTVFHTMHNIMSFLLRGTAYLARCDRGQGTTGLSTRRAIPEAHDVVPGQKEMQSVDARPSDAVNLAVRCKVPIYVHKDLVASDAVKPVVISSQATDSATNINSGVNLDIPSSEEDPLAEEMTLVKSMVLAAAEERYADAARWRDELNQFRSKRP